MVTYNVEMVIVDLFMVKVSSLREHHLNYFNHIFDLFKPFISKDFVPKSRTFIDKKTNITYKSISFATLTLPCFNNYRNLFYNKDNKKIVPLNINKLLTPKGLAYWIRIIFIYFFDFKNIASFLQYNEFYNMNMLNLYSLSIIPVITYNDAFSNKNKIILDNKEKAGVYCWTLLSSQKSYVGSSLNLGRRLINYFNPIYISHITRKNMVINKALLKYGYSKFKLEILEYCEPKDLARKEQYYMDILNPEYNLLKTAYSSLGYKHTKDSLEKIKKQLAILNRSKAISVKVTNLETNISDDYDSLTAAAKTLNTTRSTLQRHIINSKLFKGIYKLESNLSVSNFDSNYLNHPNSIKIEVTDLKLKTVTRFTSIFSCARVLGIRGTTISNFLLRNQTKPFKGRFIFKKIIT
jgi:hypothetical protein